MSGLANKTCTGTSKRYQLCKVQVRISFFLARDIWWKNWEVMLVPHDGIPESLGVEVLLILQQSPYCPSSSWSSLFWLLSLLLGAIKPSGVLVPSALGFPWLSPQWEEEDVALDGAGDGRSAPCRGCCVPGASPTFDFHQDVNASHSRSALQTEGAFERSSVHPLTPMCIMEERINGNLYTLVTRHSLCVS